MEIDEVTASIVKRRESTPFGLGGLHTELNAQLLQSLVLFLNIVSGERRCGYPFREQSFLERSGRGVVVWLSPTGRGPSRSSSTMRRRLGSARALSV